MHSPARRATGTASNRHGELTPPAKYHPPVMKAWLLDSQTGLSALRLVTDAAEPVPGPGEVVLAVELASLNPADRYLADGQYPARPAFPHILGRDAVGTVVAVGAGVTSVAPGAKRAILRGEVGVSKPGTLAERVAVPEDVLVEVPPGWSNAQAAGAPLVYLTAYQAITQWTDLKPGGVVLVTGASGGVGLATVQLAAAMGFVPVGLSRDAAKYDAIRDNGARLALSPDDKDWSKQLYAECGKRPVTLAVDNIGGKLFPEVIDTLAQDGRVSVVGRLAGTVPEFNTGTLFFRRVRIGGVAVGTYTAPQAQAAWREVVRLLDASKRSPLIDRVFPLEELLPAFERLRSGPLGKVLVRVS